MYSRLFKPTSSLLLNGLKSALFFAVGVEAQSTKDVDNVGGHIAIYFAATTFVLAVGCVICCCSRNEAAEIPEEEVQRGYQPPQLSNRSAEAA